MSYENPLDQFFGVNMDGSFTESSVNSVGLEEPETEPKEDLYDELYEITIDIPENAELSDITKLALEAYKQQIEILKFIEPKFRNRGFEVAQTYLNLARDSIKQDVELKQKRDRLILDREKAELGGDPIEKTTANSRENLFEIAKQARAKVLKSV